MARKIKDTSSKDTLNIHKQYLEILNCVPDIIYWTDENCTLIGCNNAFVQWLGLKKLTDLSGTPYEQMTKFEKGSDERIEAFKLDDMAVIFSGQAAYRIEEKPFFNKENEPTLFQANRVPTFDKEGKRVTGLIVVLSDITALKKAEALQVDKQPQQVSVGYNKNHVPNILMVEDNIIAQKVEEALLKGLNCNVDIADSGDKAVSLFNPGKYDVVLMDISLQDTSGYLVAKQIRQKEENTDFHVTIIALTSYQAEVVQYDVEDYCMDGVLTKPLTSEQAQQIIQHYIYHENVAVVGLKDGKSGAH